LNRRSNARFQTRMRILARVDDNEFHCDLFDISAGGVGVQVSPAVFQLTRKKNWHLEIPNLISVPALRMWQAGNRVGLRFEINPSRRQSLNMRLQDLDRTSDVIWMDYD